MEIVMLKGTFVALAGALGLALLAGPSAAENYDSIKLRVPVQLKSMLATAKTVTVTCSILRGNETLGKQWSETYNIVNGEFDQIIEVIATPDKKSAFSNPDGYSCELALNKAGDWWSPPKQGTPSGNNDPQLWRLAKPDQFFRAKTEHTLDGLKVGVGGPKDLKGQKQP